MVNNPCRYFLMMNQTDRVWLFVMWCLRRRLHLCAEAALKLLSRVTDDSEAVINFLRSPHFWGRAKVDMERALQWYPPHGKPLPSEGGHSRLRSAMQDTKDFHGPISGPKAAAGADKASNYYEITKGSLLVTTGMPKLRVSAKTRWGTRPDGADKLDRKGRLFGAAVAQIYGNGSLAVNSDLAVSIFSKGGMEDAKRVRFARLPGQALHFLTSPDSIFATALIAFDNRLMVRPLLRSSSTDLECSSAAMCGVGSHVRRLLLLLTNGIFIFPSWARRPGAGQHHMIQLAHRGWRGLKSSCVDGWILKPTAKIKDFLGRFSDPAAKNLFATYWQR